MNELMVQKKLAVSPSLLWTAWSDPEHIKKWWCPRPWQTIQVAMERKIGGCFDTQMRSPEGQDMELGRGCFLEVVPYRKLAFTSVLEGGFVPAQLPVGNDCLSLAFSALIEMEPVEGGTLYTARARHACPSARQAHADMGFVQGWGVCIDQLEEVAKSLTGTRVTVSHSVEIEASPEKVWQVLFDPASYPKWTRAWDKASRFEGGWDQGQPIHFLGSCGGGLAARVERSHRPEFLSVRYTGHFEEGQEVSGGSWAGGIESYRLTPVDGATRLEVFSDVLAEYAEFMDSCWPKALQNVRVLAELDLG